MKQYHGTSNELGCVVVVEENGQFRSLDPRTDLRNHSPSGFAWGYGGSGPAQLALALAADVLHNDERALEIYQQLKFRLIGRLDEEGWVLSENRIRAVIETVELERDAKRHR